MLGFVSLILRGTFSGAGFGSKSKYMYGKVTIQLKLVEGDSAGTVTAFYVSEQKNYSYYDMLIVSIHLI